MTNDSNEESTYNCCDGSLVSKKDKQGLGKGPVHNDIIINSKNKLFSCLCIETLWPRHLAMNKMNKYSLLYGWVKDVGRIFLPCLVDLIVHILKEQWNNGVLKSEFCIWHQRIMFELTVGRRN